MDRACRFVFDTRLHLEEDFSHRLFTVLFRPRKYFNCIFQRRKMQHLQSINRQFYFQSLVTSASQFQIISHPLDMDGTGSPEVRQLICTVFFCLPLWLLSMEVAWQFLVEIVVLEVIVIFSVFLRKKSITLF